MNAYMYKFASAVITQRVLRNRLLQKQAAGFGPDAYTKVDGLFLGPSELRPRPPTGPAAPSGGFNPTGPAAASGGIPNPLGSPASSGAHIPPGSPAPAPNPAGAGSAGRGIKNLRGFGKFFRRMGPVGKLGLRSLAFLPFLADAPKVYSNIKSLGSSAPVDSSGNAKSNLAAWLRIAAIAAATGAWFIPIPGLGPIATMAAQTVASSLVGAGGEALANSAQNRANKTYAKAMQARLDAGYDVDNRRSRYYE